MRLLLSATLVLTISDFFDVCQAHVPPAVTHLAFQWPDGHEPTVDGDLKEWAIIPEAYILRTDPGRPMSGIFGDFFDLLHSMSAPALDTTDFHIPWSAVGWSDDRNLLYVAVKVMDDMHYVGEDFVWLSDYLAVLIDADHSGGRFGYFSGLTPEEERDLTRAQATNYGVLVPPPLDRTPMVTPNAGTWMLDPPYAYVGWMIRPTSEGGVVVTYEFAVMPFDWLDWRGLEESRPHDLKEGEVIGFNFYLHDADIGESQRVRSNRAFSLAPAGQGMYAENLTDLRLAPVEAGLFSPSGIGSSEWGRLKALYREWER